LLLFLLLLLNISILVENE